jgi:AAA+ superfamily predicted ATPase
MNNIDVMINTGIISYFRTNNPLIDGFILMIIASFTSYFFSKKHKIIKKIKTIFNTCLSNNFKYKIKLLAFESSSNRRLPSIESSIAYNAVNFCIKNIIKCDINEITENYDSFKKFNKIYEHDFHDKSYIHDKVGYDITQTEVFLINKNIYGLYDIEIEEDGNNKNDNTNTNYYGKKKYLSLMSNISLEEINKFIEKCIKIFDDYQEKVTKKGPFIFTYKGLKNNFPNYEEKYFKTLQTFDNSIFDCKEELINAISKFKNEQYYIKHPHITRKFIPLFYGEPGTGKTFAIRLIAQELKRNIIVIHLNKINSIDELNSILFFNKLNEHKITPDKCVFVLEDLDAMTDLLKNRKYQKNNKKHDSVSEFISLLKSDKQENDNFEKEEVCKESSNKTELTMSDILNTLDGIYKLDNYVIAFSTNHIEQLDPAFLRDQRITHKIEFKKCSRKVIKDIIEQWYDVKLSKDDLIKLKDNTLTLANITTICDKCNSYNDVLELL